VNRISGISIRAGAAVAACSVFATLTFAQPEARWSAAEDPRLAAWDDPRPAPAQTAPPARTPTPTPAQAPGPAAPSDSADIGSFDAFDSVADSAVSARKVAPHPQARPADGPFADSGTAPGLIMLPMAVTGLDTGALAQAAAGLRLGLAESGRFRILTQEAASQAWPGGSLPSACFEARCVARAAASAPVPLVLSSHLALRDSQWVLRLVLAQAQGGVIPRALQVWSEAVPGGLIPFAREAGLRLADPDRNSDPDRNPDYDRDSARDTDRLSVREGPSIEGALFATGPWRSIPWLNPKDSLDHRARTGWTGAGLVAAGAALAYAQGQLLGADDNSSRPAGDLASASGPSSYLRGFFASPALGARFAAMGGAGVAAVADGISLLMNPAGVAQAQRENVVMAKRSLPDGTPSFFVAYAGPLFRGWHQGLGAQYEGDGLANETTVFGTLACDLGMLWPAWDGVKAGAQAKLYLAQAGMDGTGQDRSTGHSYGMGWDFGVQAPLSERITAALSVRDAFGFLRHQNTFTDRSYGEILPVEWKVGAAYRADHGLIFLLDGQKGIWADQADHLRVGGEETLWDVLALRGGLHETFGRETVRAISVGFGLDTDGLKEAGLKMRLSLDYAFEFGLEEDAPLAGGQQFSLEAGF